MSPPKTPTERIFVALDTTDADAAVELAARLKGLVGGAKLGSEFFTANGPGGVERVRALGMPVFLDLKFHDIPNTVAGAVRAALAVRPFMLNVHAAGGEAMMRAAAEAAADAASRPLIVAVTVLTSLDDHDLKATGILSPAADHAVRLARLAWMCGLDGVVCSAKEIVAMRGALGRDFRLVVPGIRPEWAARGDQKRVVTPKEAVSLGADYIVVGRPITHADDPVAAARRIAEEIAKP